MVSRQKSLLNSCPINLPNLDLHHKRQKILFYCLQYCGNLTIFLLAKEGKNETYVLTLANRNLRLEIIKLS